MTKFKKGYTAISSVLVILVITLAITTTLPLQSVNEIQSSMSDSKSEDAKILLDGCIENALMTLNIESSIPTLITTPYGSCNINITSHTAENWVFTASINYQGYNKSAEVSVTRGSTILVNSWVDL